MRLHWALLCIVVAVAAPGLYRAGVYNAANLALLDELVWPDGAQDAPEQGGAPYLQGLSFAQRGEYAGAIESFALSRAALPELSERRTVESLNQLLSRRQREEVVRLGESVPYYWDSDGILVVIGRAYLYMGKHEDAIEALARAYELSPQAGAARWLAAALFESGDGEGAIAVLESALAQGRRPKNPTWLLAELGRYYVEEGRCREGLDVLNQAKGFADSAEQSERLDTLEEEIIAHCYISD